MTATSRSGSIGQRHVAQDDRADVTLTSLRPGAAGVLSRAMPSALDRATEFAPITLDQLSDAGLMRRIDRKFLMNDRDLRDLLAGCLGEYRILDVTGSRSRGYLTRYFDTPDLMLYRAHHSGRLPRSKVRIREYIDTGERYVEVKRRTNTGRVDKARLRISSDMSMPLDWLAGHVDDLPLAMLDTLREVVQVTYTRLTLVHGTVPERMTVDVGLALTAGDRTVTYPSVAFVEVKQHQWGGSPSIARLRALGIREGSISKYCLGVADLIDGARTNLFNEAAARVRRIGATEEIHVHA